MAIYVGSRHEFDPVYAVQNSSGQSHLTVYANTQNGNRGTTTQNFQTHVLVDGQRLEQVAAIYYGDASYWWYIADANSDKAYDPINLVAGTLLRIPLTI